MKKMNPHDLNRWIGSNIYRERGIQKMSQAALAEAANVSRVFISQLENGNQSAKIDTYYRIACALDISLCTLFRSAEDSVADDILLLLDDCTDSEMCAYIEVLRVVKKQYRSLCE